MLEHATTTEQSLGIAGDFIELLALQSLCCVRIANAELHAGTDYVDLILIHWPGVARMPADSPANAEARLATWAALQSAQCAGKVRAIGVSNFTAAHLQHLWESCRQWPAVQQIEVHPHYHQV